MTGCQGDSQELAVLSLEWQRRPAVSAKHPTNLGIGHIERCKLLLAFQPFDPVGRGERIRNMGRARGLFAKVAIAEFEGGHVVLHSIAHCAADTLPFDLVWVNHRSAFLSRDAKNTRGQMR